MEQKKKIALLIDYDNFNKKEYFKVLLEELSDIGDVLIKYAFYSNFADTTISKKFIEYGIEPKSQLAYSSGKNAVDISIALEAMELLRSDYIDCFCLATNDSDFTPLVKKLKKYNKFVIGAGDNKASDNFKNACDQFVSVESIIKAKSPVETKKDDSKVTDYYKKKIQGLVNTINEIIDSNHDVEGYSDFSWIILTLKNRMKDFTPKNYGSDNKQPLAFFQKDLSRYFSIKKEELVTYVRKNELKKNDK